MGKDLKGKELGRGLSQRPDGRYMGRAQVEGHPIVIYDWKLKDLKAKLAIAVDELKRSNLLPGVDGKSITLSEWFEEWYTKYKAPTLKDGGSPSYKRKFLNYYGCNRQEAMTLAERLGAPIDDSKVTIGGGLDDFMHQLCDGLGATLRAPLVVRVGARGAWIREPGGETIHIEGYPTKAVHTRSAGGCHTGVMCAMLAKGHSLAESVKIANAAASIAIQHSLNGVPQCPDYDEAIALIGE